MCRAGAFHHSERGSVGPGEKLVHVLRGRAIFRRMDQLFSPWRSHFIANVDAVADGPSPFACAFNEPDRDAENFVLHRGRHAFIIMNLYPYNAGHLLVVPVREVGDVLELDAEESAEMMRLVQLGVRMLTRALSPHGFNVGMNLGRVAGAAIERHVHIHIVPRFNGDTNFMPVLADVRVISEGMRDVYDRLVAARTAVLLDG